MLENGCEGAPGPAYAGSHNRLGTQRSSRQTPAALASTPASPAGSGRIPGSSPGEHRPRGLQTSRRGEGQPPPDCSHAPLQSQHVPPIWGCSWLLPQPLLLLPPQPQTAGRLPSEEDGTARAFLSPLGPSHCLPPKSPAPAALLLCAHRIFPGTENGEGPCTPPARNTGKGQRSHRHLAFTARPREI